MINSPIAQQLRPKNLSQFYGQSHLLAKSSPLFQALESGVIHSMILYGATGSGKTTLAQIIATTIKGEFIQLSAVSDGIKALKEVIDLAKSYQKINQQLVLFIDEIHRFNKTQQDVLLPHIESGLLVFIGATTHNPAFEINQALLSRLQVYHLKPLEKSALTQILERALQKFLPKHSLSVAAKNALIDNANGDARRLLNSVQLLSTQPNTQIGLKDLAIILDNNIANFDKVENFYNQLSAFHKSVRGSSPDGALYWFGRMLDAGIDAKVVARRLLAIASEDIGNADPKALEITLNAWDIYHRIGDKEGHRAIAQAIVYCAVAAKSNAIYLAFNKAIKQAKKTANLAVPKHLCNAPDEISKQQGLGLGYRYAHDEANAYSYGQTYFPNALGEQVYYQPSNRGIEAKIAQRLAKLRQKKGK